jgi:hypothetical protein
MDAKAGDANKRAWVILAGEWLAGIGKPLGIAFIFSALVILASPLWLPKAPYGVPLGDQQINANTAQKTKNSPSDFEIMSLLVLILQAIFLGRQTGINKRQADIADATRKLIDQQQAILREQADISARQADISERATTVADEPRLIVQRANFMTLRSHQKDSEGRVAVNYEIQVVGKTPAILRAEFEDLVFAKELPRKADRNHGWIVQHRVVEPDDKWDPYIHYPEEITEEIDNAMRGFDPYKRDWKFFLIGRWVYDDIFGRQHEYGFCFYAGRGGGLGLPYGGAEYNYRRERKQEEQI